MLKQRIIASLIIKNNMVVQSIGFKRYLPIGSLGICVENLNRWGVDEIAILDIDATKENRTIDTKLIQEATKFSFVPVGVGGGIKTTDHIEKILKSGADKVVINHAFWNNPSLITEASKIFGSQCIVVSLDAYNDKCYDYVKQSPIKEDILNSAQQAVLLGAGEILLNNVKRDGKKQGLDIKMITALTKNINIPVIAQGGVGNAKHIQEALEIQNLSAIGVGNFFHFTEHAVNLAKGYIKTQKNYSIRNETYANYINHHFDEDGRVDKISDEKLFNMWFEYHPKEVI